MIKRRTYNIIYKIIDCFDYSEHETCLRLDCDSYSEAMDHWLLFRDDFTSTSDDRLILIRVELADDRFELDMIKYMIEG